MKISNHQYPAPFIQRMETKLGDDFQDFIQSLEEDLPVSIRLNPAKSFEVEAEVVPWHPDAYYLKKRPSFTFDPLFHAGAYYVQEASSMLLHSFYDWSKDSIILDLCAAPGGKSSLIAGAMSDKSLLVANDVISSRAKILAENITRWGNPNVVVSQNDPTHFGKFDQVFDLIAIDAPCSGEGMFRKDPRAISEWSEDHIQFCHTRQKRILSDVLPALKAGGSLIYSTCTWSESENEEVIKWLIGEFDMQAAPQTLPSSWGFEGVEIAGIPNCGWRALPHRVKGEGFFICRLIKKGNPDDNPEIDLILSKKYSKYKKSKDNIISEKDLLFLEKFIDKNILNSENFKQDTHGKVSYLKASHKAIIKHLQSHLRILQSGIYCGKIHRNGFAPAHNLALSPLLSPDLAKHELDYDTAIRFLRKEDFPLAESRKGWLLLTYKNIPLGWGKGVGNKLKNHFPINWRIRKG